MLIYVIETEGYNPDTLQVEPLYFCTGAGFTTSPTDSPPSTVYLPRIKQAGSLRCEMFAAGATSGRSSVGMGEATLSNADGAFDHLRFWGFDGHPFTVKFGDDSVPIAELPVLYVASVQQVKAETDLLTFVLRDKQFTLDRPVQDLKFQGTNIGPDGLEGTADDIIGKPKPIVLGKVRNVTPVCVNTSTLIYALNVRHGGQFDAEPSVDLLADFDAANIHVNTSSSISIIEVRDRGVTITRGADYANSLAMVTTAPAAGTYRACPSEGYFRMGSAPSGAITVDCMDGFSAATAPTTGNLAKQTLNQLLSILDDDINLDDLAALDALNPTPVGVFLNSETTGSPVLDEIFSATGAWYGYDRLGVFRVRPIVLPLTDPVLDLDEGTIESYEMVGTVDGPNGIPVKRININWGKNYTVQKSADLAGAVGQDERNQLAVEYRQSYSEDLSVLRAHQQAGEMTINSSACADQSAEAARRLEIYKEYRDRLRISLKIRPGMEQLLDLGKNVTVTLNKTKRYGYDTPKIRKIISFDLDCSTDNLTLVIWG